MTSKKKKIDKDSLLAFKAPEADAFAATAPVKSGKIAAVGDKDSLLAFKAVGADTFSAAAPAEADEALKRLAKDHYSVIFITEELAAAIPETLRVLKSRVYPAVVPIPSASGTALGFARENLRKDIERAVGADVGTSF